ncbi:MAG: aminoacyl-tRNA hydrolase [Bacteroidales bacterium]|nr:aminoacyl-tRNA hydrolase [Bacteroidales bacterium]
MKYLIVGLGNIGAEYKHTRHNIGFDIVDALANEKEEKFEADRLAAVARIKHKGRIFVLIKPSTYMNLSGKAVNYWLQTEKINIENLLIVTDDIALEPGSLRMRSKGGHGGHNGLENIIEHLGTQNFTRLRFGIGNDYRRGRQADFVLSQWKSEEKEMLNERIEQATQMVLSFGTAGVARTMNLFNNK